MEYSERGPNPRYIVTNLKGDSKELYDNETVAKSIDFGLSIGFCRFALTERP